MIRHTEISAIDLRKKIKAKEIRFGGNKNLKIYGTLNCPSGKRMKKENRVFFLSEKEARANTYRPCGCCLRKDYNVWKNSLPYCRGGFNNEAKGGPGYRVPAS